MIERKVRDSCGKRVQETPQAQRRRGGFPDRPRKASAWSGNQRFNSINTQKYCRKNQVLSSL
ncbi:hypothetical protein KEH51_01730 [[Brevibacterium] frigoritolerans]|uniref:Uncharacterized protein n=1 Tax=Peribacillus frigoritolerans TaxID=450367 RepID=A0A941FNX0_9BACI|nr:hypothetical protein [Peribacillus frigoritolerans]